MTISAWINATSTAGDGMIVDHSGGGGGGGDGPPSGAPQADVRLKVRRKEFHWPGVVARIDGQIDRATRTVGIIVEVNQPAANGNPGASGPTLVPGLFVEVTIEGRDVNDLIAVPRGSVHQQDTVYIVKAGQLVSRSVSIVRVARETAFVDGGIDDGDLVIVSPMTPPVENMTVRTIVPGEEPDHANVMKGAAQ